MQIEKRYQISKFRLDNSIRVKKAIIVQKGHISYTIPLKITRKMDHVLFFLKDHLMWIASKLWSVPQMPAGGTKSELKHLSGPSLDKCIEIF